jgi:hypothetical protein
VTAKATVFSVGTPISARTVYIFFDLLAAKDPVVLMNEHERLLDSPTRGLQVGFRSCVDNGVPFSYSRRRENVFRAQ